MKVLYLSHLDPAAYSALMSEVKVGDVMVTHTVSNMVFYLVKDPMHVFGNAIETAECDMKRVDNQTLFDDTVRCQCKTLNDIAKAFNSDCVKAFFQDLKGIQNSDMERLNGEVIMNLFMAPAVNTVDTLENLLGADVKLAQKEGQNVKENELPIASSLIEEYEIDTPCDMEEGILIQAKDLKGQKVIGRYTLIPSDEYVIAKHSTLGNRRFHAVRVYSDNHILGWEKRGHQPTNFILMSETNRSSAFSNISTTCFAGYHIAYKSVGGTVSLIDSNAREMFANMRWNDVLQIHSGYVFCRRGEIKSLVKTIQYIRFNQQLDKLDEVSWQKDSIFFVKKKSKWHVFNGNEYYKLSRAFVQITWISNELVCCFDGLNYCVINPYEDVNRILYEGLSPNSFLKDWILLNCA